VAAAGCGGRRSRSQYLFHRLRPIRRVGALLVAHEPGIRLDPAHDADLRRVGKRFFEPVAEPVGELIADHQHRLGRRRVHLFRRRRLDRLIRLLALLRERIVWIVAPVAIIGLAAPERPEEIVELYEFGPLALIEGHVAAGRLRPCRHRQSGACRQDRKRPYKPPVRRRHQLKARMMGTARSARHAS
jgi:hypothetical protein